MSRTSPTNTVTEVVANIIVKGPEDSIGKDEGFISKVKEVLTDLTNSMSNKEYAFEVFEKNFLFLKSFGLVFLIILAVVNYVYYKNSGLISDKPLLFFAESVVFGMSGVIPFLVLSQFRNRNHFNNNQIFNISVALFLVFFGLNYLLELSGIYPAIFGKEEDNPDKSDKSDNPDKSDKSDDQDNYSHLKTSLGTTSDIILLTIFIVSIFSLFFATAFVRNMSPNYNSDSLPTYSLFIIEMLLFGVISAVPVFFMASNRGVLSSNTTKEFLLIVVKFSLLHCLLQLSGFYSYIFTGKI
jgi:hypothetical protein